MAASGFDDIMLKELWRKLKELWKKVLTIPESEIYEN